MTSFRTNWNAFRLSLSWFALASFALSLIGATFAAAEVSAGISDFLEFISLLAGCQRRAYNMQVQFGS
jgi:hypothetical protein